MLHISEKNTQRPCKMGNTLEDNTENKFRVRADIQLNRRAQHKEPKMYKEITRHKSGKLFHHSMPHLG